MAPEGPKRTPPARPRRSRRAVSSICGLLSGRGGAIPGGAGETSGVGPPRARAALQSLRPAALVRTQRTVVWAWALRLLPLWRKRWLHRNVQKQANASWILTPLLLPEMLPKLHPPGVSAQRKTAANENPPTAQSATWLLPGGQVRRTSCTSTWWLRALKEEIKMDAEPVRKFGMVVVGVGRAGSVRIRDLKNPEGSSAYLNLIGFVSRRKLGSIAEVQQIPLEDALSSQEVEVAFICSESSSHEHYIRQFLSAGKHVLVEYPMALSLAAAQELWDLAEKKGKVLHEEHIELLMEEFAFLKREVLGKELLKGSLLFTAGPLEEEQFGFPAFSGISRLTWLVSLFGELSLVSATLEEQKEKQYMKMTVHLETKDKCPLSWIEEKGPGFQRNRYLSFHFKSGSLENIPNIGVNKNIFLKDQDLFVQKLLGQVSEKELAAERKRVLHCLALADAVQRCCRAEK
ncbi:biliverdin reductase A-like isoform X2 [Dipodomys spectabilis]|uniref:biliverdin reductase A-like isoform X2 n=1 Tax=Dipodomys spectabilis TaxID=105255 RepID=UPI001C54046C|nr:biliverdin reductase A-like isoform X2 [Dipodomys spectabilis]